jgi:hypothetical protein
VLVEVLQGIRDGKQLIAAKRQFENLTYLEDDRSTFELGATIYRELRRQRLTIRNSMDCLTALPRRSLIARRIDSSVSFILLSSLSAMSER